jgi:hypothetical protein
MKTTPSIMHATCLMLLLHASPALAESELLLTADTPIAKVLPRSPERAPLTLPELEFNFRIRASCSDDLEPASISLAVADTRRTFNSAQIASGKLDAVRLRIPASQIAPVVIANFCVEANGDDPTIMATGETPPLTIRSALSAHASLLCASESHQSMKYSSTALDVLLQCDEVVRNSGQTLPL